jgi:hypothetical protein
MRHVHSIFVGYLTIRHHFGGLELDGWIISKGILKKQDMRVWNGFNWLSIGPVVSSCERDNKTLRFIIIDKFDDQLSNY